MPRRAFLYSGTHTDDFSALVVETGGLSTVPVKLVMQPMHTVGAAEILRDAVIIWRPTRCTMTMHVLLTPRVM